MSDPQDTQEFDVVVHPLDDGSYWAEVCGLPGCLALAGSYTEIVAHIRDAHDTCLTALGPAPSAESASALREARTAGALGAALLASGWKIAASGKYYHVFATFGRDERIAVPSDPQTILNEGYLAAIRKLLG